MAAGRVFLHETPSRDSRPYLLRLASALDASAASSEDLVCSSFLFLVTCFSDKFHKQQGRESFGEDDTTPTTYYSLA